MNFNKIAPLIMVAFISFMTILMKLSNSSFYMILLVDSIIFGVMFGFYLMILFEDRSINKKPKTEKV